MATPHENQNDAEQKKKAKKAEKRQRKKESKPKYQKKIKRQHAQKNQQAAERFAQTHHGLLSLNRFNTLILHLFLTPVMTLIYYPLNRYIFLPLLRDGQPYISTNGETIEHYFSASSLAWLVGAVLSILTLILSVRRALGIERMGRRVLYLIMCLYVTLLTFFLFLNFSLWI